MKTLECLFSPQERRWLKDNSFPFAAAHISVDDLWKAGFYIFGAGYVGKEIASCIIGEAVSRNCEGLGFRGFIDNNAKVHRIEKEGIPPIIGLNDVVDRKAFICVVSGYAGEMARQCHEAGFLNVLLPANIDMFFVTSSGMTESWDEVDKNEHYIGIYHILADDASKEVMRNLIRFKLTLRREVFSEYSHDDMYFPSGLAQSIDYSHFVDCGAYDGDTFLLWLKKADKRLSYKGYEPSSTAFEELSKKVSAEKVPQFKVYPYGLSDENKNVSFANAGSQAGTCCIAHSQCSAEVVVKRFDDVCSDDPITFFKADVEGSEIDLLNGAKKALSHHRPCLAICTYHKKEHLWEIPEFILSMTRYNIFLRHHDKTYCETVCYGIPA